MKRTLSQKPAGGTHWTMRGAAQDSGISKSTVHFELGKEAGGTPKIRPQKTATTDL
jgi:hypothetical protein